MIQEALLQDIPGPFELEVSVYTRGEYGFTSFILLTLKNLHLKMFAQVICCIYFLTLLNSIDANSVDPYQTAGSA